MLSQIALRPQAPQRRPRPLPRITGRRRQSPRQRPLQRRPVQASPVLQATARLPVAWTGAQWVVGRVQTVVDAVECAGWVAGQVPSGSMAVGSLVAGSALAKAWPAAVLAAERSGSDRCWEPAASLCSSAWESVTTDALPTCRTPPSKPLRGSRVAARERKFEVARVKALQSD